MSAGREEPTCPSCHSRLHWVECIHCAGAGRLMSFERDPDDLVWELGEYECSACNGDGSRWSCPVCEGYS